MRVPRPRQDEFFELFNEYLQDGVQNLAITTDIMMFTFQLCRIPDCIPDPPNATYYNSTGVCVDDLPLLSAMPGELPTQFPTEYPR